MRKQSTTKFSTLASIAIALCFVVFSPVAYAGAPLSNSGANTAYQDPTHQDSKWLALKNAFRYRSGIQLGQGKGAKTHPFVASAPLALTSAPSSYELTISNAVPTTFEPGDRCYSCGHINFTGTYASYDDSRTSYYAPGFFDLCGPGAADNALWYWPNPPNLINLWTYDQWDSVGTTWNGTDVDNISRMRGYMMDLAWDIHAPTWSASGMMNAQSRANAVMLQVVRDGLNWEASGENSSNWQNYFYVVAWWNQYSKTTFHSDVVADIYYSHVPVIAEVNARLMPNWPNTGGLTRHYITIIGYNDSNGTYQYTDTCANITGCGSNKNGGVTSVSQSQMWNAITSVPVDQSTGDGGWVW